LLSYALLFELAISPSSIMSSESVSINASSPSGSTSSSVWDRLSTWATENKAVVYTIAGTAVVITGAGVVYYLSEARKNKKGTSIPGEKRKSKRERRKEKRAAEEEQVKSVPSSIKDEEAGMCFHNPHLRVLIFVAPAAPAPKVAAVEAEDELPQIDETTVDSFSQEVRYLNTAAVLPC
jgi:mitochondrial import receptor subunit TOM70